MGFMLIDLGKGQFLFEIMVDIPSNKSAGVKIDTSIFIL